MTEADDRSVEDLPDLAVGFLSDGEMLVEGHPITYSVIAGFDKERCSAKSPPRLARAAYDTRRKQ
jgi:hypothetical protein